MLLLLLKGRTTADSTTKARPIGQAREPCWRPDDPNPHRAGGSRD